MEVEPRPGCLALQRRVAELEAQVAKLLALFQQLQRAGKRQAAPFSKRPPNADPKKPGRKPGAAYGAKAHRSPPAPEAVTETHKAPLPADCPDCGGPLEETGTACKYQVEIPRRPIIRAFHVQRGRCRACGRRVQGRHPLQTSDALGAAAAQLGPDAQAAVAVLQKDLGLSHGKVGRVFGQLFGIRLSRGSVTHVLQRLARRSAAAYQTLTQALPQAPWIVADETGWRVGGRRAWLHTFVGPQSTCYRLAATRSGDVAAALLGRDYWGLLIHDGWAPYDHFVHAGHQQCLAHLLRRCRELLTTATRGAVRFPRAVAR